MQDCHQRGNYVPCYFDTCCLCPIYQSKYERLSPEQRMALK
jgi:Zn-finger protein